MPHCDAQVLKSGDYDQDRQHTHTRSGDNWQKTRVEELRCRFLTVRRTASEKEKAFFLSRQNAKAMTTNLSATSPANSLASFWLTQRETAYVIKWNEERSERRIGKKIASERGLVFAIIMFNSRQSTIIHHRVYQERKEWERKATKHNELNATK